MRKLTLMIALLLLVLTAMPAAAGEDVHEGHGEKHSMALADGRPVELVEMKAGSIAYLEGTILGDMDALFGKLVGLGMEQGLIGEDTKFGSVYPSDMSLGVDEETPVYVAFSLAEDAEVAEPLMLGTLEGGMYLKVDHLGDYAGLSATYTAIFEWAATKGIELGVPSFEHYVTDPKTTPVDEWLVSIYFPFEHEPIQHETGLTVERHNQFEGQQHDKD